MQYFSHDMKQHFPRLVKLSLEESAICKYEVAWSLLFTFYLCTQEEVKKVKGKKVKCMESENANKGE